MITISEPAQNELVRILQEEGKGSEAIRLGVKGGGCSGFTYVMDFANEANESDHQFNKERVPIVIDAKSITYISGLHIDFASDLLNRGFKFSNPNATQSCGCGTSFAV